MHCICVVHLNIGGEFLLSLDKTHSFNIWQWKKSYCNVIKVFLSVDSGMFQGNHVMIQVLFTVVTRNVFTVVARLIWFCWDAQL